MRAIEKIIRGGVALALGALLAVSAAPAVARAETVGAFEVTGGTSGQDYTYTAPLDYDSSSCHVLTVNNGTPPTISTNDSAARGCRIVIPGGVTANITLAGVSIKPAAATSEAGLSGIDLVAGHP